MNVHAHEQPFDPGLQPERTGLAWQRTVLALGVAVLLGTRLLANHGWAWAGVMAAAGVAIVVVLLAAGHRRYRRAHDTLTATASPRLPSGASLLAWAITAGALGLTGAVAVLVGAI